MVVGLMVGLCQYLPTWTLALMTDWKLTVADQIVANNHTASGVALAAFFMGGMGFIAAAASAYIVIRFAPAAEASGLPQLIVYMAEAELLEERQGLELGDGLLDFRVVLTKIVALTLACFSGLAIGREGPAVHIGAGFGWIVAKCVISDVEKHGVVRPGDPDHPLAVTEGGLVHTLVVAGGAAGFAAAFNAPLGGMLYMLEEIALPSGWSARATRGSFVAAASAVLIVKGVLQLVWSDTSVSYFSIVIFEKNTSIDTLGWSFTDIIPFLLLGALCGMVSGMATHLGLMMQKYRKTASWRTLSDTKKVLEISVVALLSSVLFTILPAMYRVCVDMPNDDDEGRRLSGLHHAEKSYIQYTCADDKYSPMASLTLAGEEGAISHLFGRDTDRYPPAVLTVFLLFYVPCQIAAAGSAVPAGTFVPMLLCGACLGRIMGEAVNSIWDGYVSVPGVYAAVGAAACLGGFTRSTIAVVATICEITGDVSIIAPTMVVLSLSRFVASKVTMEGYTHGLVHRLVRANAKKKGHRPSLENRKASSMLLLIDKATHHGTSSPLPSPPNSPKDLDRISESTMRRSESEPSLSLNRLSAPGSTPKDLNPSAFRDPALTARADGFNKLSAVETGDCKTDVDVKPQEMELAGFIVEVAEEGHESTTVFEEGHESTTV